MAPLRRPPYRRTVPKRCSVFEFDRIAIAWFLRVPTPPRTIPALRPHLSVLLLKSDRALPVRRHLRAPLLCLPQQSRCLGQPLPARPPQPSRAYDELKTEESDLIDSNEIKQTDPEKRLSRILQLVQAGRDKTVKEAVVKQRIEVGVGAMSSIKGITCTAVQAVRQADVAWLILANPVTDTVVNDRGIAYVISRTEWYWNLSSLLQDKDGDDQRASEG
ncbi:hypothetical protein QBC46DRAFT_440650 [Diplogelasinospora grovesii]|uniref:NWD NACHT-NTPase N-terminal domain-containing protein n=1 Tax=Diplogelasinospora grovesii TaxID=303347 RepID=A0AAN6NFA0_9PEZI|nr:hypothetical protein QBC46DRAFT_440650 [Diplogelasinospora grovesii]